MPALVPGVQPFAAFAGTYTLSSDQETMTIGASPAETVRTPWYDMGSGSTLAKILWDGTASGTVTGRSSVSKPQSADLSCLIQPGDSEWLYKYDASLGTTPNGGQGWTKTGTIAAGSPSGGVYTMVGTGTAYYNLTTALSTGSDVTVFRIGVRPNTGHNGAFEVWCDVGTNAYRFTLQGSAFGANAQKILVNTDLVDGLTWAYDAWLDLALVVRNTVATLHYRVRGSNTRTDLIAFTPVAVPQAKSGSNFLLMGDVGTGVGCNVSIDHFGVWQGTEWETVTDGDTSFTVNRRYWQVKGWENGTLTEVDLQSDLSAPSSPSAPSAADVGSDGIAATWATVSGAAAYCVETYNTGTAAVVDTEWYLRTAAATSGLAAGTYRIDVYAASDDGVRSSTAGQSNTVTLPVTAATAPTIGPYPRWVSGELRFYKPTVGSNTLTGGTYAILSATQAGGAYSVADSNSWASLTWRATDGTGQYVTATDLGLTVSDTAWYRDRITDSGNLVAEGQTAVYGGDSASAYCAVTFSGLTSGATVSCRLSAPVVINGVTYAVGPYSATVSGGGTATLTLPRCNAGTPAVGTDTVFGYFRGADPDAWSLSRLIPDSATATFASLVSPG